MTPQSNVGADSDAVRAPPGRSKRGPIPPFMRIRRSAVVNIDRVKQLQPWFHGDYVVTLKGGSRLNLIRTYRDR